MTDFTSIVINKYSQIIRALLMLGAILAITALFNFSKFDFDYEIGKPWRYENLYAPFTFTIEKSAEMINAEREKVSADFVPFYNRRQGLGDKYAIQFVQDYEGKFRESVNRDSLFRESHDSLAHVQAGLQALKDIYNKGIIAQAELEIGINEPGLVNILTNNVSSLVAIDRVHDLGSANNYLVKVLEQDRAIDHAYLLDLLRNSLQANITYDSGTTNKFLNDKLNGISNTRGVVQQEEEIITQGEIVSSEKYQLLTSLRNASLEKSQSGSRNLSSRFGYGLIIALVLLIFFAYIRHYDPNLTRNIRSLVFLLLLLIGFLVLIRYLLTFEQPGILYFLPFCVVPIILRNFFGGGVAIISYTLLLLISSFLIPLDFEFIIMQFLVGLVAILFSVRTYYWSQFFTSAGAIFCVYVMSYFAFNLIHSRTGFAFDMNMIGAFAINSLLTLLAYPLIPLFERIFGFVSNISLVELGDLNKPLLKELNDKAPGTFWHSLQVASLAEACARELGADALMTKVGALYHDVGKMENPAFYIENQKLEMNPHNELDPKRSARIIIDHVKNGIVIAKKNRLPNTLIDFIRTHHGTTKTEYFYRRQLEIAGDDKDSVDVGDFTYPGPLPYNKETAIVMMADSIEAASRTLENPTKEDIHKLVDGIVQYKVDQEQFVNCDLSFKDIATAKKIFKKLLIGKYHVRVSYPEDKSRNEVVEAAPEEIAPQ